MITTEFEKLKELDKEFAEFHMENWSKFNRYDIHKSIKANVINNSLSVEDKVFLEK